MSGHIKALDLFAGTGWGVACQRLGIKEAGVEIMPEAVETRAANGMETIYHDVWDGLQLTAERHRELYGSYGLLIASPPCQTFSMAGKGAGRAALDEVLEAIELHAYKDADALKAFGEKHDPRTALVLTPLAYVWRDRPRLVAMEQVPTVLPVWEACAEVMREWGYDVKVEVLNAEQYGVPQTRKRAILVARRGGPVHMPKPTHSKYYSTNPTKLDPGVLKWVSMAEALGWGAKDQPSHTITGGVHGPTDRWASGGNSVRKALDAKIGGPEWIDKPDQTTDARTTYGQRFDVEDVAAIQTYPTGRGLTNRPAPTITGGGTETGGAEPIAKYHQRYTSAPGWVGATDRLTPDEAATLQSYPTGAAKNMGRGMVERYGDRPGRSINDPAFTVRASAGGTEPGGFVWKNEDETTRKATASEVGILQTYERPFVWCGTKTKQFLQIGNAVPPLLAEHILAALVDSQTWREAA
ncbi:DNA cytosine methyltransferase [uncultured Arthrobacter sp.]|uniref:DNA cytosine methyltransferase n=1 Tax=uncultured Arthrobacter sp. TaxID=114050 RepID=UPI003217B1FA